MFKKIRRPGRSKEGSFKKIFSYIVFGLICAVFIFIVPVGSQFMGEGLVAKVGRERIMNRELKQIEENLKQSYQKQRGLEELDETHRLQIRSSALQQLIDLYVIAIASTKEGFFLADQELRDKIQSFTVFHEKDRFLYSRYRAWLKFQKISPKRFEEKIRRAQKVQNWSESFNKAFRTNKLEKQQNQKRHKYKIRLEYAEIPATEFKEEELLSLLKDKNRKAINRLLKKEAISWEKTEEFSLFLPVRTRIAQNPKVVSALLAHLPEKGLIPSLIRDNDKLYIVRILSFSQQAVSEQEQKLDLFLSQNFGKSDQLFESWKQATKIPVQKQGERPKKESFLRSRLMGIPQFLSQWFKRAD